MNSWEIISWITMLFYGSMIYLELKEIKDILRKIRDKIGA